MKLSRCGKIIGIVVLLTAAMAAATELGIKVTNSTASWRYKMTVEVETPEGIKSGSAVREVTVKKAEPEIQSLNVTRAFVRGEAVAVDLGKRGVLFAIMDTDGSYDVVFRAFPIPGKMPGEGGFTYEGLTYYSGLKNTKAVLKTDNYPMLVRFRDIKDPKTVENVYEIGCRKDWSICAREDYYVKADHFEEAFGNGVRLKEITIEMTDEPVTWGIEKFIPWLARIKGGYLDGQFSGGGPQLSNILHGGNFKRGEKK